jgi:DNA-binding transcriptional MerR regulator
MNNLIKIKDVSSKYSITARTLRYYEDIGLINSTRSDDYAYRMYDESAVKRLEQILILRKLNISIKDIQRIFSTSSSNIVLEVLEKKVQNIDDEVALLHELKDIVLDFIHEIERIDFADNSDIKLLYDKAKELETQLISVDYIGKPSKINRLLEITEKLDKKVPDVMVVRIPSFRAVTSGDQLWGDMFENGGYMNQLWKHCHLYQSVIFDSFDIN